jgi:hypothetical protein
MASGRSQGTNEVLVIRLHMIVYLSMEFDVEAPLKIQMN